MGSSRKKKQDKKKKKPFSPSDYDDWSSNFDMLLVGGSVRFFKWEILNFFRANVNCISTDYFLVMGCRLRFLLFPKGLESRNAPNKHLSLRLERGENKFSHRSCFIRSKISVVNHEDKSNSVWKTIYQRFSRGGSPGEIEQFVALDSLLDTERGFLLNGTDLHIRGDVIFLFENQVSRPITARKSSASTSGGVSESSTESADCGDFAWIISNFSYFEEAIAMGKLKSDPFKIGDSWYRLRVCSETVVDEEGERHLSISVELLLEVNKDRFHGTENAAWFTARFCLWSQNHQGQIKMKEMFGRINKGLLNLGKMSEILIPAEEAQGFAFYKNYFQIYCNFVVLNEKDFLNQHLANTKNIWTFGEGPKAAPTGKKKPPTPKVFAHYSWEIKDFLWIKRFVRGSATLKGEVWSKLIRLGQNYFCMMISPFGLEKSKDYVGAFLKFFQSDENKFSLLIHYRLNVHNQKKAGENSRKVEQIERFDLAGVFQGSPLIPKSTFYEDSSGYIVEGRARFDAYFHVLEETMDLRSGGSNLCVEWRVDNFLAWEAIRGCNFIPSRYFNCNGCILRIEVGVSPEGILLVTLASASSVMEASDIYQLVAYVSVLNLRNSADSRWDKLEFYTNERKTGNMGNLSDILIEGAGFVVNDKVIFGCEIILCKQGGPDSSESDAVHDKPG